MKKNEMENNITLFAAYLDANQNDKSIKEAGKQYRSLFGDVIDKNRAAYAMHWMNLKAVEKEIK